MDDYFDTIVDQDVPLLNKTLTAGVAVSQLKNATGFVDSAIRSASKSFIPGLEYHGGEHCTPEETFAFLTAKGKTRKPIEMARSDYYMMKYRFSYNGVDLPPRYIFLPFVGPAGFTTLRGARHLISPTINDIVFSVTNDTVFVRLQRDKFRFHRLQHSFLVDGDKAEVVSVIWSELHRARDGRPAMKGHTTAVHYLLAKYGLSKVFELFEGFTPVVGYGEINFQNYPKDKWVIVSTAGFPPKAIAKMNLAPTKIRLAIPRDRWEDNPRLRSLVGGLYYILDHFPDRIRPEWMDNTRMWRILLGKFIHAEVNEGVVSEKIDVHIRSIDDYMDLHVIRQLQGIGYHVEDFYQLLALMLEKFSQWIALSSDHIHSMYGKELNVNGFTLFPITSGIIRTVYAINKRWSTKGTVTDKEIIRAFNQYFKPTAILSISSNNAEVSSLSVSNDNMALRLTSMMVQQTQSDRRNSGIDINDPRVRLHPSIAEHCSYVNPSKKEPDGRSRLNLCTYTDENYRLVRNPDLIPLTDQALIMIRNR